MTNAVLAQGATITFDGSPVPEVTNFDIGADTDDLEVTSHDSPDSAREYIPGLRTPSEVAMTVNWTVGDHAHFWDIQGVNDPKTLSITTPDGTDLTVQAYVKSVNLHGPATGAAQTADLVFRTTGLIAVASS